MALVQNGVCDAETIDIVVKTSFGRRMAVLGPLEHTDLVGTDLTLDVQEYVSPISSGRRSRFPISGSWWQGGSSASKTLRAPSRTVGGGAG